MTVDWMSWLTAGASAATILSFAACLIERRRRRARQRRSRQIIWTEVALDSPHRSGNSEYRNGELRLRGAANVCFAIGLLQQGDKIRIRAKSESPRFSINIGGNGTWFYHFNPRVAENVLVQNSQH